MNVGIVFPGQGSQNKSMLEGFKGIECFNQIIKQGSDILGYDIIEIIQDDSKLNNTIFTQPLILTVSYAIWNTLKSEQEVNILIGAGHSLGEYSALVANESMSFEDGLLLVKKRAELMSNAMNNIDGAMAAVIGLNGEEVNEICNQNSTKDEIIEAVNFNCPGQTVIAGHSTAVDKISPILKSHGAKIVKKLPVSLAAHTSLLKSVTSNLKIELQKINFNTESKFDVIHNYDLSISKNIDQLINALSTQVCSPVRWIETMELFKQKNIHNIIEIGPGTVLSGLVKRFDKEMNTFSTNSIDDVKLLIDSL